MVEVRSRTVLKGKKVSGTSIRVVFLVLNPNGFGCELCLYFENGGLSPDSTL